MNIEKVFITVAISALLTACGSDQDAQTDDTVQTGSTVQTDASESVGEKQLGFIYLYQGEDDYFDSFGNFISLSGPNISDDTPLVNQIHGDFIREVDQCTIIGQEDEVSSSDEDFDNDGVGLKTGISAGETITLTSEAGTYATLQRTVSDDEYFYEVLSPLPTSVPQNLIIDISGEEFPAFSDITFPSVAETSISLSTGEVVNADTTFQWVGSDEPDGRIHIYSYFNEPEGNLNVRCVAKDDGSFSFPTNVRSQIAGLNTSSVEFTRIASRIATKDNATLYMGSWMSIYR